MPSLRVLREGTPEDRREVARDLASVGFLALRSPAARRLPRDDGPSELIGGRPDVYGDPDLLKVPYRQVFKDLMDNAQPSRITANWRQTEAETAFGQLMQPLWTGEAKPDKAFIDSVSSQIQAIMDKPKA